MGLQARLMSQALRKLVSAISKSKTCVVFINQIRMKIGIMYGSPENDHGRQRAQVLRHHEARHTADGSHQGRPGDHRQPDPSQGGQEQDRTAVQGGRVRHRIRQGHLQGRGCAGPGPWRRAFSTSPGPGILSAGRGWGQGRENAKTFLREHGELLQQIEQKTRQVYNLKPIPGPAEALEGGMKPPTG